MKEAAEAYRPDHGPVSVGRSFETPVAVSVPGQQAIADGIAQAVG